MSQDEQQNDPTADAGDMYGVDSDLDDEPHTTGGGRTLGGEGTTSKRVAGSAAAGAARPQKKFATLGDLSAGDSHGHSHGDDSSDDEKQDFFAGGEKSGLAVQNPDDIKKKIIEKAKKYVELSLGCIRGLLTTTELNPEPKKKNQRDRISPAQHVPLAAMTKRARSSKTQMPTRQSPARP